MDIAIGLFFVVISLCLILSIVTSCRPKWLEITYVEWSRPKKIAFTIALSAPLFILLKGAWALIGIFLAIQILLVLERQNTFASFRFKPKHKF
jgi:hypothetical protein